MDIYQFQIQTVSPQPMNVSNRVTEIQEDGPKMQTRGRAGFNGRRVNVQKGLYFGQAGAGLKHRVVQKANKIQIGRQEIQRP